MTIITAPISAAGFALKGFISGVWNPEDMIDLPQSRWIVISAMRSAKHQGCLLALDAREAKHAVDLPWQTDAGSRAVPATIFAPHGLSARALDAGCYELLVVDHGGGEAIDRLVLRLERDQPAIIDVQRIVQPAGTSGNAVVHLPDGGFLMTSMFDPRDPDILAKFARAEKTGGVWRWSPQRGWSRFGKLPLSGANGITASADGSRVFVAEWAAQRLWRLTADGEPDGHLQVSFLPDNLRWMADGRLLLAGQLARPEDLFDCAARGLVCPLGFEVAAVDPRTLAIECLISASDAQAASIGFGGATGALQIGDEIWVTSFTGNRVAKFARAT